MEETFAERYAGFYGTALGGRIVEAEARLCLERLKGRNRAISVGCGPAVVEARIMELAPGMDVTGVDRSAEMLAVASPAVRTLRADAGDLPFPDRSFDGLMFVTSLEFLDGPRAAVEEGARVLEDGGGMVALILNPASHHYRRRVRGRSSYIQGNIKGTGAVDVERMLRCHFDMDVCPAIGVRGDETFDTTDPAWASIIEMSGTKRASEG